MTHLAIYIDWYGPYRSVSDAQSKKHDYCEGLYVAIGVLEPGEDQRILYIGLSNNPADRVGNNHTTLAKIDDPYDLWLGEVSSTGKSGPKRINRTETVDLAESTLIYGFQPELNSDKIQYPPKSEVTVLSRWWRKDDYDEEVCKRPHKDWADVVDYRGEDYDLRLGWTKWY